jgi:WD40 repeat protein
MFRIFVFMGIQVKVNRRRKKAKELYAAIFSPDSMLVIAGNGWDVEIWDTATGALIKRLQAHSANVWSVAVTRDGNYLASGGGDGTIMWWDLKAQFVRRSTLTPVSLLSRTMLTMPYKLMVKSAPGTCGHTNKTGFVSSI